MKQRTQSPCPICYSLDVFGDKWTLLIIRDLLVGGKRYYRDFLNSGEGIATNVLADRLKTMLEAGLITKADDPHHGAQNDLHADREGRSPAPRSQSHRDLGDAIRSRNLEGASLDRRGFKGIRHCQAKRRHPPA